MYVNEHLKRTTRTHVRGNNRQSTELNALCECTLSERSSLLCVHKLYEKSYIPLHCFRKLFTMCPNNIIGVVMHLKCVKKIIYIWKFVQTSLVKNNSKNPSEPIFIQSSSSNTYNAKYPQFDLRVVCV